MLSPDPIFDASTKHIELDIHFVKKKVVANLMQIHHVPAHAQIADILRNPLPTTLFVEFRTKLKVVMLKIL